jgi:hypothetical protein
MTKEDSQRIRWCDLGLAHTMPIAYWICFRVPTTITDWHEGRLVSTHLNPPTLRRDEILVGARQMANMTDARVAPFLCLKKAVMRACGYAHDNVRFHDCIGHIRLGRYTFRTVHGGHVCDELVPRLMVLAWTYGPSACLALKK